MMQIRQVTLLVFLLFCSCTFTSDEEFFENIDLPDPSGITIDLSGYPNSDTIHIYETTQFRYQIDANRGKIKSVKVTASGLLYEEGQSPTGDFTIYQNSRSGTYEVSLEFSSTTGSGSLADVIGAEGFVASKKWLIAAHFERPSTPNLDFKIVDGLLQVSWPKYTKPNFRKYFVRRIVGSMSYGTEISDPNITSWSDDGYSGGPLSVQYSVTVENKIGSAYGESYYSHPLNVRFAFNRNDTSVTVQWKKNPFYGAFREYVIKTLPNVTASISHIDDTVRTFKLDNLIFGGSSTVSFEADANENDILFNNVQQTFALGDSLPEGTAIYYSKHIQSYVLNRSYPQKALFLDNNLELTHELSSSQRIQILPYPGRYFYNFTSDRINQVDIATGQEKTRITGSTVTGWNAADNGTILIRGYYRNFGKFYYSSFLEDIVSSKDLYYAGSVSTVFDVGALPVNLADDGKHFVALNEKKVYKIIPGDTSILVGSLGPNARIIGFRTDDSNEIMLDNGSSIALHDANTLTFLRNVGPPESGFSFSSYDPHTKYMLWVSNHSTDAYLVQIETGNYRKTKLAATATLLNGHLFIPARGLYIKVIP